MRLTSVLRGLDFGKLGVKQRGIVTYELSPFELRPLRDMIAKGVPNILHRTRQTVITWLPTFVVGYMTYVTLDAVHKSSHRKDPLDYANEVDPNPE